MSSAGDGLERARATAMQALKRMQALSVPPTPENYAVWYAYVSGSRPDLIQAVLRMPEEELREDGTARLFEQFLSEAGQRERVRDITNEIEQTLLAALSHVEQAQQGAATYGDTLTHVTGRLGAEGGLDHEALTSVVNLVLSETHRMADLNRALEDRLQESSQEIHRLREDLETVRVEASTDALTGLPNRRSFDVSLRSFAAAAGHGGGDLCLLILDIDHFKRFNDTHGHQTGDHVLRLVAKTLQAVAPEGCLPARLGGEEFCVLAPQTSLGQAAEIAENLRQAVGSKVLRNRKTGADLGTITLSVGVSLYDIGEPLPALIDRADEALYLAKRSGRNRVCLETDLVVSSEEGAVASEG